MQSSLKRGISVRINRTLLVAALGAALLSGCQTTPVVHAPPPPVPAPVPELPYRWTQGNAPQAHKDAVALFGPLFLKPGDFRWAAQIPEAGDTKVVIDLMT